MLGLAAKERQKKAAVCYKEGRGGFSRDQARECCKQ